MGLETHFGEDFLEVSAAGDVWDLVNVRLIGRFCAPFLVCFLVSLGRIRLWATIKTCLPENFFSNYLTTEDWILFHDLFCGTGTKRTIALLLFPTSISLAPLMYNSRSCGFRS